MIFFQDFASLPLYLPLLSLGTNARSASAHASPFLSSQKTANTWTIVGSTLYTNSTLFTPTSGSNRSATSPFTLVEKNLHNLRPGYIVPPAESQPQQSAKPEQKERKKRRIEEDQVAENNLLPLGVGELAGGAYPVRFRTVEETQRTYESPADWEVEHPYSKDGYKVGSWSEARNAERELKQCEAERAVFIFPPFFFPFIPLCFETFRFATRSFAPLTVRILRIQPAHNLPYLEFPPTTQFPVPSTRRNVSIADR